MSQEATTEVGNRFRQTVATYLSAAGHPCTEEVRLGHIKVDVLCTWIDTLRGPSTIAIEAKWRSGNIDKPIAREFMDNYRPLLTEQSSPRVHEAWLISNRDISADARKLIEVSGLRCFTLGEMRRRIMALDAYVAELAARLETELAETSFVPLRDVAGDDLLTVALNWINDDSRDPLMVFGGYGTGKTTFAKKFALTLATAAARDSRIRIPVIIPLGEVYDEQHITGLLARAFAERFGVFGYNFRAFERLNEDGAFVVIFDGLDEMADAMTAPRFERNLQRLLALDRGAAKLLFLTRQTVFHTAAEYDRVVLARAVTPSGNAISLAGRRPFRAHEIALFNDAESLEVLQNRFVVLARRHPEFPSRSRNWLRRRLLVLRSEALQPLRGRPVHIEMLAQVATDPAVRLARLSRHTLYDRFVQQLVERESGREGRFVGFDSTVRRRFNTALAWWVWNRDEGMSVRLADIPAAIVESATGGADHPYGDDELKRELVAGCLIDNAAGGAHYRHRSIQEFLVAEHFQQTLIEGSERDRSKALELFMKHSNPEIADFVVSRLQTQAWPDNLVKRLVSGLLSSQLRHIPRHVLALVSKAASERMRVLSDEREPWGPPAPLTSARAFVLGHAIRIRSPDLRLAPFSLAIDTKNLRDAYEAAGEVWDAAVLVWGHALREPDEKLDQHLLTFLAQCFCSQTAETKPGGVDTSSGALLACMAVEKHEGSLHIELNLELLTEIFEERIATSFDADHKAGRGRVVVRVEIGRLLDHLTQLGWNAQTVETVGYYLKERRYQPFRDNALLQRHTLPQHST